MIKFKIEIRPPEESLHGTVVKDKDYQVGEFIILEGERRKVYLSVYGRSKISPVGPYSDKKFRDYLDSGQWIKIKKIDTKSLDYKL